MRYVCQYSWSCNKCIRYNIFQIQQWNMLTKTWLGVKHEEVWLGKYTIWVSKNTEVCWELKSKPQNLSSSCVRVKSSNWLIVAVSRCYASHSNSIYKTRGTSTGTDCFSATYRPRSILRSDLPLSWTVLHSCNTCWHSQCTLARFEVRSI